MALTYFLIGYVKKKRIKELQIDKTFYIKRLRNWRDNEENPSQWIFDIDEIPSLKIIRGIVLEEFEYIAKVPDNKQEPLKMVEKIFF